MKSKMLCAAAFLACLAPQTLQALSSNEAGSSFSRSQRPLGKQIDRNELRAAVDESQSLFDTLARETLALTKDEHEALYRSLGKDYGLNSYTGKALERAEEVLEVQSAIKNQQGILKALPVADASGDKEEAKLLGLQSDLIGAVEGLRDHLRDMHKNADENEVRDLHNWLMVSEGQLRGQREERDAKAAAAAAALPPALPGAAQGEALSAEGLSPSADAEGDSASAHAPSPAPTPQATPLATPVKGKAAKPRTAKPKAKPSAAAPSAPSSPKAE